MRKAEATDNVLFDRFWVAYPKKVGKEKARRAFEKLHPTEDLLGQMLEARFPNANFHQRFSVLSFFLHFQRAGQQIAAIAVYSPV